MSEPLVLTELSGNILTITMNRPEKRNAIHGDLLEGLGQAFERAREDPDVKGVLLRGEGKAFSAGIDFMWLGSNTGGLRTMADFRRFLGTLQGRFNTMEALEKPIVAAIHTLVGRRIGSKKPAGTTLLPPAPGPYASGGAHRHPSVGYTSDAAPIAVTSPLAPMIQAPSATGRVPSARTASLSVPCRARSTAAASE